MPTGLKTNKLSFAKMGNINIQAVESQSEKNNNGSLNIQGAAVVGKNKVVAQQGGNISQNAQLNISPAINQFQKPQITLPILTLPKKFVFEKKNNLFLSPIQSQYYIPTKLKGVSEQRPEIISLADFGSIYSKNNGVTLSDVGEFVNMSIAARKLRFDHIEALIGSIQEVEGANKILEEIAEKYAGEVSNAESIVKLMEEIVRTISNIKESLDVRKSEDFTDEKVSKNIVSAKSYKDFLVDLYGFSESGVDNFSNTKLIGQFLFDARNTLEKYSPTLFGSSNPPAPNSINAGLGFQINQPNINENFFNPNFGLAEAGAQTVERSADREFGSYNINQFDITDSQFEFNIRSFRNIGFPILGTAFNQFLDSLPGNSIDRAALLLMSISKEMRISSGLGNESIKSILIDELGGSDVGNPFETIIGFPGDNITDVPNGTRSLCSLLRYKNTSNEVVLPFEAVYVKGENGSLYVPGTKEFGDSILQSEAPYDISKIKEYQESLSEISSNAISLTGKLLGVKGLKSVDLFDEIGRSYDESIDSLISDIESINEAIAYPSTWGEVALIKLAFSDREISHLLFQYVLALGLVGKPGEGNFGNNSVESFFRDMSISEIRNWGDFPVVKQDKSLSNISVEKLNNALVNFLGLDEIDGESSIETGDVANTLTSDSVTGYTVLAFIAQTLVNKAKLKGDQNGGAGTGTLFTSNILSHFITPRSLVFMNKIADFIATIANKASNFTEDGKTRFNRLNYTTIASFAFEAFLSFIEPLLDGVSQPNTNEEYMTISVDINALRQAQSAVRSVFGNYKRASASNTLQVSQSLSSPIGKLKSKLLKEETIINQIISRLRRTFGLVERATSDAVDFFNPQGPNYSRLASLVEAQGGKERISMVNEAQFVLSRKALSDFNEGEGLSLVTKSVGKAVGAQKRWVVNRVDVPVFIDGSVISSNEKKFMETIFRRPKFRGSRSENLKILTIGLPAGFSNCLSAEIGVTEDNAGEIIQKQRDVISINVYRRSIEFEDIVFKPRPYIFELSRFVTKSKINNIEIKQNNFLEFLNDKSIEITTDFGGRSNKDDYQTQESFFNNEEYSFLSNFQKRQLAINHVESFILGLYLKLLTGVSTDESDYLINDMLAEGFVSDESKEKFKDLVLTYVQGVTQQPITLENLKNSSPQIKNLLEKIDTFATQANVTEQITPPVLPGVGISERIELAEDLINFVKLFTPKSLLTGGKIQSLRITSPKLFERIFNLAVDPDDFEIDLTKTFETTSGAKMYEVLEKKGLLMKAVDGKVKIRERSKNNTISLDQFFVNVSTVGKEGV